MARARNGGSGTQTAVSSGGYILQADTSPPRGGGEGFRPHELLEAALASCTAMTLRLVAQERGIALNAVEVAVELDRSDSASVFRTAIAFDGALSEADRKLLTAAARLCPVRKTLEKAIAFEEAA